MQRLWLDGQRITTTYDALGRVVAKIDPAGYTTHTYDMGSRLTSVALPLGKGLGYAYDPASRRTRLVDTEGGLTSYAAGRPLAVLCPFAETTTWQYDPVGRQIGQALANGVNAATAYDAAGRPTHRGYVDPASATLLSFTATYDAAGNRVGVAELDGAFAYGYDPSNQLIAESRTGTSAYAYTYVYDPVGNRLSLDDGSVVTTYAYNAADELLTTDAGGAVTTYAYDANGNTIGIDAAAGVTTLTWDAENRLTAVASPDGNESYTYDSTTSVPGKVTGLRRSKTTSAGTTHFVWDQQNLLAELDESLQRFSQYTGWPGSWGGLASARAGASSSFFGFDLSANTRAVFDALGAVDVTALFSAFGPMLAGNLSGAFRYGGQVQYYTDARWLQVRARDLEVLTGRWLSRDPLGRFDADWPFGYVANGPVGAVDGSGLLSCADWRTGTSWALLVADAIMNLAILFEKVERLLPVLDDKIGSTPAGIALVTFLNCVAAWVKAAADYVVCSQKWCDCPAGSPPCNLCAPVFSCAFGTAIGLILAGAAVLFPEAAGLFAVISALLGPLLSQLPEERC